MKSVVMIGASWSTVSNESKPMIKDACTKLGYHFTYDDIEVSEEAQTIIKANFFRKLPVLMSIDPSCEDGYSVRYKVDGFDYSGIVSFLNDEDDTMLRELDFLKGNNTEEDEG